MNNQIKIQAKGENNILIIPSRIGKELENSNLISYEDFVPYVFNRELVTSLEIDKPKDVIVNVNGQDIKAKAYTVIEVNQLRNTDINIMNDMEELRMNKCPRCESEMLKSWNHCPKCGLKLEMTREQAIEQLKDLVKDRESFCVGDYDVVFELDIQALEYAIKELERTAQEVPVQEQLVSNIDITADFVKRGIIPSLKKDK